MTEQRNQSPDHIVAEIESTRAEIDRTLSALEQRISPQEVVNLVGAALVPARDGAGTFAKNLGTALRDNPVPAVVTGLGLGWLAISGRRSEHETWRDRYDHDVGEHRDFQAHEPLRANPSRPTRATAADDAEDQENRFMRDKVSDAGARASERVRETTDQLRDKASRLSEDARRRSEEVYEQSVDAGRRFSEQARDKAARGSDFVRAHPVGIALAVAGIGALVGAAMLARSEPRRRYIAQKTAHVRSEVEDRAGRVADSVRESASSAAEKARDVAHRAEQKAKGAADSAEHKARDAADSAEQKAKIAGDRLKESADKARERVKGDDDRDEIEDVVVRPEPTGPRNDAPIPEDLHGDRIGPGPVHRAAVPPSPSPAATTTADVTPMPEPAKPGKPTTPKAG